MVESLLLYKLFRLIVAFVAFVLIFLGLFVSDKDRRWPIVVNGLLMGVISYLLYLVEKLL